MSLRARQRVLAASFVLLLAPLATVGDEFRRESYFDLPASFYPGADYDPAIPTFASAMGFAPGEWFTSPSQAEMYLAALDRASDRVRLTNYGRSYEGRPLLLAILSSPANLTRLEAIRANLAQLRGGVTDAERDRIARETPVVVWLGYGIHGDEHSGTEAAMLAAYHLTADRSEETRRWLDEVIVLIDPAQNPDGRQRFLRWQEATVARDAAGTARPDPDPAAAEHRQPWPGGRFNHYLFDLNRDWFMLTQAESRARVAALLEWNPQVFCDLHEMDTDSTYYFAPPTLPINPIIPEVIRRGWEAFGAGNARMFDRFGVDYYTREDFDAFYPGYGDSFTSLNGAVGMTYEQASARGLAQRRKNGTVLTLREAAANHFLASLATIRTAAERREQLVRDFGRFFQDAVGGEEKAPREIWIRPGEAGDLGDLADHLERLGVELRYPTGQVTNDGLRPIAEGKATSASLEPGGILIPMAQSQRRLLQTLFERELPMEEAFLREEEEKRRRREPDGFFDITAWTLPYAYGVDAFWADKVSHGATGTQRPRPAEGLTGPSPAYAYLLRYDGNAAARALVDLLALRPAPRVQMALRGFTAAGEKFARGTLVVKRSGSPGDLAEHLQAIARKDHVLFTAVASGLTEEGADLGSSQIVSLRQPRVAVLYGDPASPTATGWLAYLLEQELGLDYTRLAPDNLGAARLSDYDVLVFPDSDALGNAYRQRLGKDGIEHLQAWIESGGVFVGIGGGAGFAASEQVGWTSGRPVLAPDARPQSQSSDGAAGDATRAKEKGTPTLDDLPVATPGAVVRVLLDEKSFLTAGYGDRIAVPLASRLALTRPERGRVVGRFESAEKLRLAGFMWDETRKAIADQSYLVVEKLGEGKVILFAADPAFRAFWPHLHRLLLNALVVAPSI